ncbi:transporter substrate-binding domain-containing protein [Haloechinothrix halophila]|uniref:transporter substrate-binding domain-containing protein n=1 Tax=Haloechinothrix halophila TaxID=1069073 RepID=UPI0004061431|nr:transporter substrate-binding domain-containing protein [Haloechinothrix halophila]
MARRSKLTRLALLPAAALALTTAACGGGDDSGDTAEGNGSGVELVNDGTLTTCTSLPYPPFQAQDDSGEIVGFDVDMIDILAEDLGVEQEIIDVDFAQIKNGAALNAGKCDVAAAGMTITEERKENLGFSVPYFDETLAVVAQQGSDVTGLDDVESQDLTLGVQADTTSLDYATSEGFKPQVFRHAGLQVQAMQAGKVDVVLQDLPTVLDWMKNKEDISKDWEVVDKVDTGDQYGYAVEKGNSELLDKLDESLKKAFEDGRWAESYEKWIGEAPEKTPTGTESGS